MFQRLCTLLEDAGADLSAEELRDVLWLAVTTAPAHRDGARDTDRSTATAPADGATADGGPAERVGVRSSGPREGGAEVPEPAAPAGLFAPGGPRPRAARPARAVGVRGVPALPAARGLSRALRPLRQSVPSRRAFTLDEAATADWIADTGLPDAVLRPERERWLSVALVVDDGPSMVLWQRLAAEVRAMLERQGAFLDVRTYGLDSAAVREPVVTARPYAATAPRRGTGHLTDTSGRTAVLVLSDGVGPGWRSGAIPRALRDWARYSPVAVIQPLPPRMWPQQGMPTQRLVVSADRPGAPGRALSVRHPVLPPDIVSYTGTVVPVLDLSPAQVGAWADLTATGRGSAQLSVLLLPEDERHPPASPAAPQDACAPPDASASPAAPAAPTPEERLRRFRAAASPESQRLAGALAAVSPLTLPVMRLIHQAASDGSERYHPAQLAEVFLGGLLRRRDPDVRQPSDAVEYAFRPGVADLLLDAVQTSTALDTAAQVTRFLLRRRGGGPEFRARLSGEGGGDSAVAEQARPFAAASPELLLRLGLLADSPARDDDGPGGPHPEPHPKTATRNPHRYPPRSYASERVQPPLIAVVRRIAEDEALPQSVRLYLDPLLAEADQRSDGVGWEGVTRLTGLASELVNAGWHGYADWLCDAVRAQLPDLAAADDLESRNLRGHLALALNVLGEHDEAEEHLRSVVAISGRVHGEEHDFTLFARSYLVSLLQFAGRRDAAEEECRSLIASYERRADSQDDHTAENVAEVRMRLGLLLNGTQRHEEALAEFRAVVAVRGDVLGPSHTQTVLGRAWLAAALQRLRRYEEAEAEARTALADARAARPEVESAVLPALYRLADILLAQDRRAEAYALVGDLPATVAAKLGVRHWRTLEARRERVAVLRRLRRYEEAEAEAVQLVDSTAAALGERHVNYFSARRLRAMAVRDRRVPEEAEAAFRELLDDQVRVLGRDHDSTLLTLHELALTLEQPGRWEESLALYTEVLEQRTDKAQQDRSGTLITRYNRVTVLMELGRDEEAETECRATLAAQLRLLGPDHPETLSTRKRLGDVLRDRQRHEEAEREFRSVIEGRSRVLGPEDRQTLAVRHSLGYLLAAMGRFAEAEVENRATLAARRRVLGPENAATLWTHHNLGKALHGLGRLDEAAAEWRALLEVGERALGEDHRCTRDTRKLLTELLTEIQGEGEGEGEGEGQGEGEGDDSDG
ncbi:SAV_2336 N-terminal domain-related protein [Streptomyces sp. NPDC048506]|uniref:SAV_2336 N-terminal domain-related protein n=1 Tax=Streptomyces sp. NPDC048506 TaxID=3155028 RepID=UPI00341A36D3